MLKEGETIQIDLMPFLGSSNNNSSVYGFVHSPKPNFEWKEVI